MWLTFRCAPSLRVLQWVAAPGGACRVASRIRASSSGVSTVATCPKCRLYSPAMRCSVNRRLQLATKPRLQSMRSDTSSQVWPSASSKISRARRESSARPVRLVARRVSSLSSEFVRVIASLMDTIIVYKWLLQSTRSHFSGYPGGLNGSTQRLAQTHSALKTKAKASGVVRSTGTQPWRGFDRTRPKRWFELGSVAESLQCRVLHRSFELAAETEKVGPSTKVSSEQLAGLPVDQRSARRYAPVMNADVLRRTLNRILSTLRELFMNVHYTSVPLWRPWRDF